jgi:N-acetylglucosamine-6-phosphate deacetylase
VCVVDGLVAADAARDARTFDVTDCTVAPGYVDLQINGAVGIDLTTDPARMWELAAALPRFGVTSFLPTIITSPPDVVVRALAVLATGPPAGWVGARPLGLHLEGPMIAPGRVGAHPAEHVVAPALGLLAGWSRKDGVAMVTLAPELPGALQVIAELVGRGVVVSAGHTDATEDEAHAAVRLGLSSVTHLFNAMAPLHHREAGLATAVLGDLDITASLIVDGLHVSPQMVRVAWRALGVDRCILVSDAAAPLGASPGRYVLGERPVVSDGRSCRTEEGGLAGGVVGLDGCVRNLVAMAGCTPAEAIGAATANPACLLGRSDLGSLDVGASGDVVVLDADLAVVLTVVGGQVAYRRAHR